MIQLILCIQRLSDITEGINVEGKLGGRYLVGKRIDVIFIGSGNGIGK